MALALNKTKTDMPLNQETKPFKFEIKNSISIFFYILYTFLWFILLKYFIVFAKFLKDIYLVSRTYLSNFLVRR